MAWLLRFDGVNDYLSYPSSVGNGIANAGDDNQHWELEFETTLDNPSSTYVYRPIESSTISRVEVLFRKSDGLVRFVSPSSGQYQWTGTNLNTPTVTFIFEKLAGSRQMQLTINGTVVSAVGGGDNACDFDVFGVNSNNGWLQGDLNFIRFTDFITPANNLFSNAASSGGTGQILPDDIGANNANLINFPTDNSQWVSTGGGGSITADVNLSISKPLFSVQASKSEPSFNASLSFEVGKPVFSVQASNTIPGSGATVSLNIASPVFSVQATKEDPPPAPTETANVNFEVSKPIFSVQASNLGVGNSANVNLSIPKPQFSVQASRTIPDTIADADITINGPIFTIYAGTDSDSFHYADGAITYISTESKTVSLPSQSRVVTIKSIK